MNLDAFRAAIDGIEVEDRPHIVRQKSRDFFWYSPILKRQLDGFVGDLVVSPKDEDEVIRILAAAYAHDVPVTVRGGGTGNYGQAMPLQGGVVLHTNKLTGITALHEDSICVRAGTVIEHIEHHLRENGREIRLFPSTTASASIGGFIAGGSSGVGAIRWGGLRNPANIRRVRLVTMEAAPRILDLTGDDIHKAAHAYGVNGVMTEIELPIDPAVDWVDVMITTPDFISANTLAISLGEDEGVLLRMLSTFAAPIPELFFQRFRPFVGVGRGVIAAMVRRDDLPAFESHLQNWPTAELVYRADLADPALRLPAVFEMAWNHTTLRAIKTDPSLTYLQMMFPRDAMAQTITALDQHFGDEIMLHFEYTRFSGVVSPVAMPIVRFTTEERLEALIAELERDFGITVFNPHRVTLEEGGMKRTDISQLEFKRQTDPKGLMNPGKMIAWTHPDWQPEAGKSFLFQE
ncbi:FAD-binding oxidoreductase [Ketogulonicigenium vulgare]|uniref:FAD linked oxidase protein n=1 Tax=Ketogulonicigenium vulgare (strain WSH-001) TaxID=759362 RepID=F9YA59_KETVW|nr:FAD-binding oxidoreductase [Ketogulonicigenium vulgare]ADO43171.1 FAD linked oxidase protein [Ketogulonicigenium vulgare Y25]AEM41470.1 FAD linked oxidase protein [Ketogulonicigenium vulgare WSH-001]ALJ81601.1 FAD-linked oxidase [Ketogulonicigenium vulgare]ANW34278.1 FAD-linked oxidase [Ketogulonicigenium vulgare]AOZ55209.1 FAD linked oxidase protein [Ketogulonicigenium vulgare]